MGVLLPRQQDRALSVDKLMIPLEAIGSHHEGFVERTLFPACSDALHASHKNLDEIRITAVEIL